MGSETTFHIALGANLPTRSGAPGETLRAALDALRATAGLSLGAVSRFYRTPCFPPGAGPDYVNAAAVLHGALAPDALLGILHRIEADFGRERRQRWGMRTLDIDLLSAGQAVLPDAPTQRRWMALPAESQRARTPDRLILPHPRLQDRAFVLVPLCDIAADWVHPVTGRSVQQMCDALARDALHEIVPV